MSNLTMLGNITAKQGCLDRADWIVLRLLMVAYPRKDMDSYQKLECRRSLKYLMDKYGDSTLQNAMNDLWGERT